MILHILQPRWHVQKVVDYMKPLYLNCEFYRMSERFDFFSSQAWCGLIRIEGPIIWVGEDPHLLASRVSDLRAERDESSGAQIVRWTQPLGVPRSSQGQCRGQPIERVFQIGTDGHISEL